jgi:hypothetical protein
MISDTKFGFQALDFLKAREEFWNQLQLGSQGVVQKHETRQKK